MIILGIETSCDETAAAVYDSAQQKLRADIVSSQVEMHARYHGVVPELSARAHVDVLPNIVDQALAGAGLTLRELDAVAVTHRPGLIAALLAGVTYAKSLAWALGKPLYGVDHIKAHLAAVFLHEPVNLPTLGLVVSGGHTLLTEMRSLTEYRLLGSTRDDAAGEAFDKVAKLIGLPYPGGPQIEKIAASGAAAAFAFPVGRFKDAPLDFSYSGLKTAVLYAWQKIPESDREARRADIAASFQKAAVDALEEKVSAALESTGLKQLIVSGGVAANGRVRERLTSVAARHGASCHIPPLRHCGDTAAQIAFLGAAIAESGSAAPAGDGLDAETLSELFVS